MERIFIKPEIETILNFPRIVSGHQPIIFYYGILLKALILNKHKGENLFLIADHDERKEIFTYTIDNNFQIHKVYFLRLEENTIFEKFPKITKNLIFSFYKELKQLTHKKLLNNLERAFEIAFELNKEIDDYSSFMINWTFKYFQIDVKVIKVSEISKSENFKNFVIEISNSDFKEKFNEILINLKRKPFRILQQNELPFWKVVNNKRLPLMMEDLNNIDKIEVRPRAYTLTLFFRKNGYAFLHGFGGYGYDKIIEYIYNDLAPKFLISGDKFLDLDIEIKNFEEFFKLKNIISDLKWHSEYLFKCNCPIKDINNFFNWNLKLSENLLKLEKFLGILERPNDFKFFRDINEKLFLQAKTSSIYSYLLEIYKKAKACTFREFPFFMFYGDQLS
ncbi:MAG: hypothetical protein ABIL49_08105 [candidate division WOR-3 bacterium]